MNNVAIEFQFFLKYFQLFISLSILPKKIFLRVKSESLSHTTNALKNFENFFMIKSLHSVMCEVSIETLLTFDITIKTC